MHAEASYEDHVPKEPQQPVIDASEKAGHASDTDLAIVNGGSVSFTDGQSLQLDGRRAR